MTATEPLAASAAPSSVDETTMQRPVGRLWRFLQFPVTRVVLPFARGFGLGTGLFCGTMLILSLAGVSTITRGDGWRAVPPALAAALAAGFAEEILVRGVIFRIVEESLGSWIAVAFSAAL